jgi:hypothetical protein
MQKTASRRVLATAGAAIISMLASCGVQPEPTPRPEPPTSPPSIPTLDRASADADRLFAASERCESARAGYVVTIPYPGAWATNDAIEDEGISRCVWFGPDELDIPDPLTQAPEGVAITVGGVGGPANFPYVWISREETTVAGRPAWRVEEWVPSQDNETRETRQLVYWVSLEAGGPTLVARTATEDAGNYALNKAVLDRMMAELTIR